MRRRIEVEWERKKEGASKVVVVDSVVNHGERASLLGSSRDLEREEVLRSSVRSDEGSLLLLAVRKDLEEDNRKGLEEGVGNKDRAALNNDIRDCRNLDVSNLPGIRLLLLHGMDLCSALTVLGSMDRRSVEGTEDGESLNEKERNVESNSDPRMAQSRLAE